MTEWLGALPFLIVGLGFGYLLIRVKELEDRIEHLEDRISKN